MATISLQAIEPVQTTCGGPPYTRSYAPAAAQVFKRGTILTLTAGLLTAGAGVIASNVIVGVAAEDALDPSGVLKALVMVWLPNPGNIFIMNYEASSQTVITDIGKTYGVNASATLPNTVDRGTAAVTNSFTVGGATIVGFDPRDTLGDTQGRVHVVFSVGARAISF